MVGRRPSHHFKPSGWNVCATDTTAIPVLSPCRQGRERETADNKITITACTASIPSERRAEGLIFVSPGSVERKPPLSLCYQLSGLVGECPAHTKDYGNDTQCLPARHLGFHPRPGHTRDYENGTHCRGAWHSVFRVGLGGFRSTTDFRAWHSCCSLRG